MTNHAFKRLPLHLVSRILARLDSIRTLGSAILSHPLFYAALQDDMPFILSAILLSQMSKQNNTLYYAIAAYDAACVDYKNEEDVRAFLADRFNCPDRNGKIYIRNRMKEMKPKVAATLSKTQIIVNYFTRQFARDAAHCCRRHLDIIPEMKKTLTGTELFRIQRAFYRYQAYCSLFFRDSEDLVPDWPRPESRQQMRARRLHRKFFSYHSPWENEQLGSILDYLENVLSHSFNVVAQRDTAWITQQVDWLALGAKNKWKQAYLSLGLEFLYKLDTAHDYPSQYSILLTGGYKNISVPPATTNMMAEDMEKLATRHKIGSVGRRLKRAPETDFKLNESQGPSGMIDKWQSDPSCLWYVANRDSYMFNCVYDQGSREARLSGYVFWNMRRPSPHESDLRLMFKRLRVTSCEKLEQMEAQISIMEESWRSHMEGYSNGDQDILPARTPNPESALHNS